MSYKEYNPAVIAIAANNLGFKKSVSINDDGTLNWWFEKTHPTDDEMLKEIPNALKIYEKSGAINLEE